MLITRYAKIVMSACLAAFCLLVVFGNITDYGTNYLFVQHVMSMDTTFPGNALMYRSITSPALWQLCYALIIAGEAITGILFLAGAIRLWQVRAAPGAVFNKAKRLVVAGALAAFLVWFLGFMVIAGEWFAMWQSQTWNGQAAAFRFYVTVLAVLIFVVLPDGDVTAAEPEPAKKPAAPKRKSDRPPHRRRTDAGRRRTDTE
jgi:predicted small integral membrane protein